MDKEILETYIKEGLSTRKIATKLNIGQTTVRHWLKKYNLKTNVIIKNEVDVINQYEKCVNLVKANPNLYNYLFGLYLGDGHIFITKEKKYSITITQDSRYCLLIKKIITSFETFFLKNTYVQQRDNIHLIQMNCHLVKYLFPKYGREEKWKNYVYLPKLITDNIN